MFDPAKGITASYALVTHPGHHASFANCSGYCYLNSAAIITRKLQQDRSDVTRVAIVDVDYHAGNGTIGIFWDDPTVMVASIHADPGFEYPYTCGFAEQVGGDGAKGTTCCVPLPQGTTWSDQYREALEKVVDRVKDFGAQALVVSLGVDTLDKDPVSALSTGFAIQLEDYYGIGSTLRRADLPTIFVQEGGYDMDRLGKLNVSFLLFLCLTYCQDIFFTVVHSHIAHSPFDTDRYCRKKCNGGFL